MPLSKEALYCFLLLALGVWVTSRVEGVFVFLLFATVISYALYPLVKIGEKLCPKLRRPLVILLVYVVILVVGILGALILFPPVALQMKELTSRLPEYASTIRTMIMDFLTKYQAEHPSATWVDTIVEQIQSGYSQAASIGLSLAGIFLSQAMEGLIYLVLLPLVIFYILMEHHSIRSGFLGIFPSRFQSLFNDFLNGANRVLESFIRGYILLAIATGVIVTLLLLPFIPNFALALGAIAALVKPLPFLGPILGSIPIIVVGLATVTPVKAFIALGLYILTQTLDDFTIAPKIMGNALNLHPLTILIGVMVLHKILGVWGAFIAAPTLAIAKLGIQLVVARLNAVQIKT